MTRAKWGQNFLADENIARKCVATLNLTDQDCVLEVGPGKGALTKYLIESGAQVVAVEIDRDLVGILQSRFGKHCNFTLYNQDFLEFDCGQISFISNALASLNEVSAGSSSLKKSFKIISNLPYAVCAPILQKFLALPAWQQIVVMVQKEVAQRIVALPGQKEYGLLSVSVQVQSSVRKLFDVARGCFRPIPKVESSIIELLPLTPPLINDDAHEKFFQVVRSSFAHRRKTIINSMMQSNAENKDKIVAALAACNITPQTRAERISVTQFIELSKKL